MKFGIFYEHQLPRPWKDGDELKLFQDALDQVELADRLGIDHAWEVEHHFLEEYSHSSAPEVFLAACAALTKTIRLGHGIRQVIPNYNHPARTAEGLGTLDIISHGRLDFGFGEGAPRLELGGFSIPAREKRALAPLREDYAFILLDCPPSLGPLTLNALVAAERVIVPVQTEYFALEGLAGLLDTLSLIQRELNPRLTVAGMLLTMHDARTKLAQDVEREVREHFPTLVFDTVIPRNIRLGEAPSFGRPVIHHDPHCAGSEAYFALAKEVASRG